MATLQKYYLPVFAGLFWAGLFYFSWLRPFFFVPIAIMFLFIARAKDAGDAAFGAGLGMWVAALLILRAANPDQEAWDFIVRQIRPQTASWISLAALAAWLFAAAWIAAPYALSAFAARRIYDRIGKMRPGRFTLASPAVFAVLWTAAEFLRAKLFFGFTWATLGYFIFDAFPSFAIYGRGPFGVYGLSFLAAFFAAVIFQAVEAKRISKTHILIAICYLLLAAGGWAAGIRERALWPRPDKPVLVFQGVLPWGVSQWRYTPLTENFSFPESYAALFEQARKTISASASPTGLIVIFPEEILPKINLDTELYQWREERLGIEFMRQELGAESLIFGQPVEQNGKLLNATLVFDGGAIPKIYAKRRLFPFVEYAPFGKASLDKVFRDSAAPRFSPGSGGAGAGILSCMELLLPDLVRKEVKAGAPLLISGGSEIAWEKPLWEHNLLISRFNAMQNRRFLIRAMKEGYSAIVNPLGEVVIKSSGKGNVILAGYVDFIEN